MSNFGRIRSCFVCLADHGFISPVENSRSSPSKTKYETRFLPALFTDSITLSVTSIMYSACSGFLNVTTPMLMVIFQPFAFIFSFFRAARRFSITTLTFSQLVSGKSKHYCVPMQTSHGIHIAKSGFHCSRYDSENFIPSALAKSIVHLFETRPDRDMQHSGDA